MMEHETIHSHDEVVKSEDLTTTEEHFQTAVVEEDKIIGVLKEEERRAKELHTNRFFINAISHSYEEFWKAQATFFFSRVAYRTVF